MRVIGVHHVQLAMPPGREAGVEVVDDEPLPGHDRFYASYPFGNRLEFLAPA